MPLCLLSFVRCWWNCSIARALSARMFIADDCFVASQGGDWEIRSARFCRLYRCKAVHYVLNHISMIEVSSVLGFLLFLSSKRDFPVYVCNLVALISLRYHWFSFSWKFHVTQLETKTVLNMLKQCLILNIFRSLLKRKFLRQQLL